MRHGIPISCMCAEFVERSPLLLALVVVNVSGMRFSLVYRPATVKIQDDSTNPIIQVQMIGELINTYTMQARYQGNIVVIDREPERNVP